MRYSLSKVGARVKGATSIKSALSGVLCLLCAAATLSLTSCYKREWNGEWQIDFSFGYGDEDLADLDGARRFPLPGNFNEDGSTTGSAQVVTIDEVRYFISQVYLIEETGKHIYIYDDSNQNVHLVDFALTSTRSWNFSKVPSGHYVGIGFTYGLDESDNRSHRFNNPPESLMFWPEALGGGYHYMQINGKWFASSEESAIGLPYGLHTGIGQTWSEGAGNGAATAFHQNYVRVEFPQAFSLFLTMKQRHKITLHMDIQRWFNGWDFAVQGGAIMQNQAAQQILKQNANDVFSIR